MNSFHKDGTILIPKLGKKRKLQINHGCITEKVLEIKVCLFVTYNVKMVAEIFNLFLHYNCNVLI